MVQAIPPRLVVRKRRSKGLLALPSGFVLVVWGANVAVQQCDGLQSTFIFAHAG